MYVWIVVVVNMCVCVLCSNSPTSPRKSKRMRTKTPKMEALEARRPGHGLTPFDLDGSLDPNGSSHSIFNFYSSSSPSSSRSTVARYIYLTPNQAKSEIKRLPKGYRLLPIYPPPAVDDFGAAQRRRRPAPV